MRNIEEKKQPVDNPNLHRTETSICDGGGILIKPVNESSNIASSRESMYDIAFKQPGEEDELSDGPDQNMLADILGLIQSNDVAYDRNEGDESIDFEFNESSQNIAE